MNFKISHGDKEVVLHKIENLYVREKKDKDGVYQIDKVGKTEYPNLKKLKHFIVSIFTDYKYTTSVVAGFKAQNAGGEFKLIPADHRDKRVSSINDMIFTKQDHSIFNFNRDDTPKFPRP